LCYTWPMAKKKANSQEKIQESLEKLTSNKTVTKLVVLIAVVGVLYLTRGLFVAALVNYRPITRLAVISELEKLYGADTLDSLVTKSLIVQEARKQGVTVTKEDIEGKVAEIEASLSGQNLDSLLSLQGMTRADLEGQLEVQIMVEKLFADKVQVTDEEVDQYLAENKDYFSEDLTEEEMKDQSKTQLIQQKLSEEFQSWLADLRQNASLHYFVKY
jgi:parvulin-like peptidyl-prolyl isomerase